jgi:non-specific serine/threonine protein kinase
VAQLEEALALFRAVGETRRVARTLTRLGMVAQTRGDYDRAVALCGEGLATFAALGFKPGIGDCLETFGELALATGQAERAARLFGSAESVRETASPSVVSVAPAAHEQHLAQALAALDATAFTAARAEGRAMSLDQAVAYALETTAGEAANAAAASPAGILAASGGRPLGMEHGDAGLVDGLTPREREAVALVAQGLSNRQIAAALVITERTAEKHVANILAKLALTSRAQVAAWAVKRGLRAPSSGIAPE